MGSSYSKAFRNNNNSFKTVTKSVGSSWSFSASQLGMSKIIGISQSSMSGYRANSPNIYVNQTSTSGSVDLSSGGAYLTSWTVTFVGL